MTDDKTVANHQETAGFSRRPHGGTEQAEIIIIGP
jgi:hypothetical protein